MSELIEPIMLNNTIIPYSHTVKSLGFTINHTLSWDSHVSNLCSKVRFALKTLRAVNKYFPVSTSKRQGKRLVMTLKIPHLLYG